MKEAAPRIFRSLETPKGQAGFDTIVAAAVAAFGSLRSPSDAQVRDFGRLVAPLWERTGVETRRTLAAALSHVPKVPRELVERLVEAPLEISAPFLVSTPALTAHDVVRLQARGDERIFRIMAGRAERGLLGAVPPAPERTGRRAVDAPPLAPEHLGQPAEEAAAIVRERLRQIALRGRESAGETPGQTLLRAARGGDTSAFFEVLSQRLSLSAGERMLAEVDESGHALARILKRLSLGTGDALAILMFVRPAVGLDVAAFEAMAVYYRALGEEEAGPSIGAAPHKPSHAPATRGLEAWNQNTPRVPFGRRKEAPIENRLRSKG